MSVQKPKIAVLCAAQKSIYKQLGDHIDVYDQKRNCRTKSNRLPVIAHPPCRGYSAFMSHFSRPPPGEKDLALFCTEQIATYGGVLEHPKHSKFIKRFAKSDNWKITTIHQEWFGYPIQKATWLLTPANYKIPDIPFRLLNKQKPGQQKHQFDQMSHYKRHETTLQFAQWLIELVSINEEI